MEKAPLFAATALMMTAAAVRAAEFPVNTRLADAQCNASIAATAEGDFVVAWSSYYGSSGRSNEIMARRFDHTGLPRDSDEFQINTTSAGNQTEPAVAIAADRGFLVVWEGPGQTGVDIFARLFDPNADPLTDELLVNAAVPGQRTCPRVAASANGSFVVVWEERDGDGVASVWARLLDPAGAKQGSDFPVAADVWDCRYPDVAMDADGNFVVAWLLDRTSRSIHAQLFDADGMALGEPFEISQIDFSSITRPSVAMNRHGHFVVAWDGDPNLASLDDVHARCYEPNGTPRSKAFRVNDLSAGAQQWPRVAVNDANEVVFVWQSDDDDPNLAPDAHARRFNLQGQPISRQISLNAPAWGRQRYPVVALAADGSFIAAWEHAEPGASDYDIFARIEPVLPWPDLNGDAHIDLHDLAILGRSWRRADVAEPADLNRDGSTDGRELEWLCRHWLQ